MTVLCEYTIPYRLELQKDPTLTRGVHMFDLSESTIGSRGRALNNEQSLTQNTQILITYDTNLAIEPVELSKPSNRATRTNTNLALVLLEPTQT